MIFIFKNPFLGIYVSEYVYILLNYASDRQFSKKMLGIDLPTGYRWSFLFLVYSPALSVIILSCRFQICCVRSIESFSTCMAYFIIGVCLR